MKSAIQKLLLLFVFFAIPAVTIAYAQSAPNGQMALRAQLQQLRLYAQTNGIKIDSLTVTRKFTGDNSSGSNSSQGGVPLPRMIKVGGSCTVSATTTIDGSQITITATAPTCAEAVQMVQQGLATAKG